MSQSRVSNLFYLLLLGLRIVCKGYLSFKKTINFLRSIINAFTGNIASSGYPPVYAIDPAATCNLRCFVCPAGNAPPTPLKNMDFDNYRRLVDEISDYAIAVFLYVVGEPFMNKKLIRFIEYAHQKSLYTVVSTNGHFINSSQKATQLVNSGLDELIFSISGISQEIYSQYHRGGRIDIVLNGVKNIISARRELGTRSPKIIIRYIEFPYNLKEREYARQYFKDLGVDVFNTRRARVELHGETISQEYTRRVREYKKKYVRFGNSKKGQRRHCMWPWLIGVINWDGAVAVCTQYPLIKDEDSPNYLGNAFSEGGFKVVWQGKRLQTFRNKVANRDTMPDFCKKCRRQVGFGDET